jgi:hypothetical protein
MAIRINISLVGQLRIRLTNTLAAVAAEAMVDLHRMAGLVAASRTIHTRKPLDTHIHHKHTTATEVMAPTGATMVLAPLGVVVLTEVLLRRAMVGTEREVVALDVVVMEATPGITPTHMGLAATMHRDGGEDGDAVTACRCLCGLFYLFRI